MTYPPRPAGPRRAPVDPGLVLAAKAGEPQAWERLVHEHQARIYDHCRWVLRNAHDAEDATQRTFQNAWKKLDQLREPAAFRGWLYQTATREAYAVIRQQVGAGWTQQVSTDLHEFHDHAPSLEEQAHWTLLQAMVWDAVRSLAPGDRTLLSLNLRDGLVGQELAAVVQKDRALVDAHLNRARKRFKKAFTALVLARH